MNEPGSLEWEIGCAEQDLRIAEDNVINADKRYTDAVAELDDAKNILLELKAKRQEVAQ